MNFLVWRQGLRGPSPALQELDPQQSLDWKIHEQSTIDIIKLTEAERGLTLAQAVAAHPCPEVVG